MANVPLGRIIAGFVYVNDNDPKWNRTVCKLLGRSKHTFMGEPTFVIELVNGEHREAIGEQLRPWFQVTDTSGDWLGY